MLVDIYIIEDKVVILFIYIIVDEGRLVSLLVATILVRTKTALFIVASFLQIIMYIGIYKCYFEMPENDNEDTASKNEVQLLIRTVFNKRCPTNYSIEESSIDQNTFYVSLALIENAYIIFWTCKDLFWSWGTGWFIYSYSSM